MTRILAIGIDPSLTRTAVAIVSPDSITVRSLPTKGAKGDTLVDRRLRLIRICQFVRDRIAGTGEPLALIESPAHNQTGGSHHDRSGLWWGIVDVLHAHHLPVVEVAPQQLKMYATGKGNSGKDEVMLAMARRHDWLDGVTNNDEMDAAVLALMGSRLAGHPIDGDLPQTHLRALAKLEPLP